MFSNIIKTEDGCYKIKIFITPKKWYEFVAVYDKKKYLHTQLIRYELLPGDFDGGYALWHINYGKRNVNNEEDEEDDEDEDEDEEVLMWSLEYDNKKNKLNCLFDSFLVKKINQTKNLL